MKRLIHFSRVLPATLALTAFSCAVSVTLLTSGCGGGNSSTTQSDATRATGSVTMTVKWPRPDGTRKIPLAANSITVTITGASGAPQTRTVARPADGSPSPITFTNLPLKGDYVLTGAAFASTDGSGTALAKASTTIQLTVTDNKKSVALDLATTIVRLEVSPRPISLSIEGANTSLTLSVAGFDAATGGNLVPVSTVTYSIANEEIATLSTDPATGITTITAKAIGQTTLTATDTENNISTTVNVEVGVLATKIWSVDLGEFPIETEAVISPAGNIYVGDGETQLHALRPDGTELTNFPVDLSVLQLPTSQPLFLSPTSVLAFDNGGAFVFDATSGAVQTQFDPEAYVVEPHSFEGGRVINKPVLAPSGAVYAGTRNGTLSKSTPSGGTFTVAQIPAATGEIVNAPSIDQAAGNVFVTSSNLSTLSAKLHAFKPDNTRLFPAVNLDGAIAVGTAISPDGSRVYAATALSTGGAVKLYGINTTNGAIIWEQTLPNAVLVSGAPVVGPDGTIYIGTWGGRSDSGTPGGQVFALDGSSGAVKSGWPFLIPFDDAEYSDIDSSVAVAPNGTIYAGSVNGKLYAIRSNGTKILEAVVSTEAIVSTPTIGPDGTIYVGARDGTFSAFR